MFRFSPNPNSAHRIHWREWGAEAFEYAREQQKPVMLYLGAFWCGICQRMDETTFSNTEIIALLNAYFVPVRVEDAQRPDIDVRYNRNGWPTIVFMSAGGDYLAAVNYLSPGDFSDVLVRVHVGYQDSVSAGAPEPAPPPRETPHSGQYQDPAPAGGPDPPLPVPRPDAPSVQPDAADDIASTIWNLADPEHGGYETERKFPHCAANEFLLQRYEATGDACYLNHVRLTLYTMHQSKTHDPEGGFFRYSSKRDWSEPHHEKLLSDHAGLLGNVLHVFELTGESFFRELAEELLDYLDRGFRDPAQPFFHGCRDYIRITPGRDTPPGSVLHKTRAMFSITDPWMYTDANARTVSALLQAARVLGRKDCAGHALETLRFLLERCWDGSSGMAHYFDDAPRLRGLLTDQALAGSRPGGRIRGHTRTGLPGARGGSGGIHPDKPGESRGGLPGHRGKRSRLSWLSPDPHHRERRRGALLPEALRADGQTGIPRRRPVGAQVLCRRLHRLRGPRGGVWHRTGRLRRHRTRRSMRRPRRGPGRCRFESACGTSPAALSLCHCLRNVKSCGRLWRMEVTA